MAKEVFLELIPVGRSWKVIAIDPVTGLEATIIVPRDTPRTHIDRIATRKLDRLVARKA